MITIDQIRKNVKSAIKSSGLTQTELAKKINISQPTVAHYIKGDKLPALDTFANLCVILDLDANEILGINTPNGSTNINNSFNNFNNSGNFSI